MLYWMESMTIQKIKSKAKTNQTVKRTKSIIKIITNYFKLKKIPSEKFLNI
jgi:hypothetical protein